MFIYNIFEVGGAFGGVCMPDDGLIEFEKFITKTDSRGDAHFSDSCFDVYEFILLKLKGDANG